MMPEEIIEEQTEQEKTDTVLWSAAESKAAELSTRLKRNIIPFLMIDSETEDRGSVFIYDLDAITDAKLFGAKVAGPEVSIPKAIQAAESLVLWDESAPFARTKRGMNCIALKILSLVDSNIPLLKKK